MLRGNYTTRIDEKGRIKIPAAFRDIILEKYGSEFFVTSLDGDHVRLYPLPEWEKIEQRLAQLPEMDPVKEKFLRVTNFYGRQTTMDGQGRILIHPPLRAKAELNGEVAVLGYITYLQVWNLEKFEAQLGVFTKEDAAAIAKLGI
ncbi:MAG: division/cell wall cluster transcriptional repressor MraZ [Blastocatellia bacterium]|nr:division/cell wall cluster transcriptional repressor MraZ [Blastocatellia bacterium]MCS7157026.1 division/cell wall cluster transcriptional repressor MraZ [Blastocatellia bacterium]MCX7752227.1 division/cell wall cluster transcriptional repressor MraZ [Blastocatellia bacterium]MDW8167719.1 division/cell wall cluster transcriptional repressor MraZ [Acidobacteriota bacterium]MDW8256318.1 division/cell wall cluster transcriptional repressor MraZ [Acidobacteriota bacterium]